MPARFVLPLRWLLLVPLLLLPFSHFRWLPNLGTTRPLTGLLYLLVLSILLTTGMRRGHLALPWVPAWRLIWPIALLIPLGVVSMMFTMLYGNPMQAVARLIGYTILVSYLYLTSLAVYRYGIGATCNWIGAGFLLTLPYAIIESMAVLGIAPAETLVHWIRSVFVVEQAWSGRLSLFCTEPSFLAAQLVLLFLIFPQINLRAIKMGVLSLMAIIVLFSGSLSVLFTALLLTVARLVLMRGWRGVFMGVMVIAATAVLAINFETLIQLVGGRIAGLSEDVSLLIRLSYINNAFQMFLDSYGIGFGIGQYGHFWKDYYIANVDYTQFDAYGEVGRALDGPAYMKPWSIFLGFALDFGVIGLVAILFLLGGAFLSGNSHAKVVVIGAAMVLSGAYPIVTPHIWVALALIASHGRPGIYSSLRRFPD